MDSKKKLRRLLALGLLVMGLGVNKGWSAGTDSIQLLVTPGVTYSVKITSVNASGYDFGTVNLAATTASTAPILVENDGSTNARWQLRIDSLASGWTCPGGAGDPTTTVNNYELRALFTDTATGAPALANFTDNTDELQEDTFLNPAVGTEFEEATGDIDDISPVTGSDQRRLWLWLNMPDANTQGAGQKAFQLSVTAIAP